MLGKVKQVVVLLQFQLEKQFTFLLLITEHHSETDSTYAYVYVQGALKVGSNISAVVTQSRDDTTTANNGAQEKDY